MGFRVFFAKKNPARLSELFLLLVADETPRHLQILYHYREFQSCFQIDLR
jgi:hypothetical protein